jgi:hypothetical protein
MSEPNDTFNPFDPGGVFKSARDANMESWAKMMVQVVNTDAYSQTTAAALGTWLAASAPFLKALETSMARSLAACNLPSRADVVGLAERLTNIEMRLDDLDAKLDEMKRATPRAAAKAKARPNTEEGQS